MSYLQKTVRCGSYRLLSWIQLIFVAQKSGRNFPENAGRAGGSPQKIKASSNDPSRDPARSCYINQGHLVRSQHVPQEDNAHTSPYPHSIGDVGIINSISVIVSSGCPLTNDDHDSLTITFSLGLNSTEKFIQHRCLLGGQ